MYLQAMRVYSAFCVAGWLAIYFAEVVTFLPCKNLVIAFICKEITLSFTSES